MTAAPTRKTPALCKISNAGTRRLTLVLSFVLRSVVAVEAIAFDLPPTFYKNTLDLDLVSPTSFAITPDGRILITELAGTVRIVQNDLLLDTPLIEIAVATTKLDRGLFAIAVDPDFAANGFIDLYFTSTEPRNQVVRYTVSGNIADPSTATLIWSAPDLGGDGHHGGGLAFHSDGKLIIGVGDRMQGTHAQSLGNPYGKLLRLEKDGTIPLDNPYVGFPGADESIFCLGLRNPFRVTSDRESSRLWVGDVGGDNDSSYEEINLAEAGVNFGWPEVEGDDCFTGDCGGFTTPLFAYPHDDPIYVPGPSQACVILGPVVRGTQFPAEYRGSLFYADFANGWIRRLRFDASGALLSDEPFEPFPDSGSVVDLETGLDGSLYYLTIGFGFDGPADQGALHQIQYSQGNQPPVVFASASSTQGFVPFSVQFSSEGTYDPDGDLLTFDWSFGDGSTSREQNPLHVYGTNGGYTTTLTVSDPESHINSDPIDITVGEPPVPKVDKPTPGTLYQAGELITFDGSATDAEDGTLPPDAFSWEIFLIERGHQHHFLGPIEDVTTGSFKIPVRGFNPEGTHFEIKLTVEDSHGTRRSRVRHIFPQISRIELDTRPSGIPILLDDHYEHTPRTYQSVDFFRHRVTAQPSYVLQGKTYVFLYWSDGGERSHVVEAPEDGELEVLLLRAYYKRIR